MELIHLPETDSTNNHLRKLLEEQPQLPAYTIVDAYAQTAGRGQRGNSWESEPGQNISCSILLRPKLPGGATTFDLNIIVSLALHDTISRHIAPEHIQVKWPNDIMVNNRQKIAGILIENEWIGSNLEYSIIGIGLNVRQTVFGDYHPTATSLSLEGVSLSDDYPVWHHSIVKQIATSIKVREAQIDTQLHKLRREYHTRLLGLGEERAFVCPDGTPLLGTIRGVLPNGLLEVNTLQGIRQFQFKDIRMAL